MLIFEIKADRSKILAQWEQQTLLRESCDVTRVLEGAVAASCRVFSVRLLRHCAQQLSCWQPAVPVGKTFRVRYLDSKNLFRTPTASQKCSPTATVLLLQAWRLAIISVFVWYGPRLILLWGVTKLNPNLYLTIWKTPRWKYLRYWKRTANLSVRWEAKSGNV